MAVTNRFICCHAINLVGCTLAADSVVLWHGLLEEGAAWSQKIGSQAGQGLP